MRVLFGSCTNPIDQQPHLALPLRMATIKRNTSPNRASAPKRTRFEPPALPAAAGGSSRGQRSAPDSAAAFDEETDELELSVAKTRKGNVNAEGYDSDSSDDGEGQRAAAKKLDAADAMDDDDDMFGGGDEDTKKHADDGEGGLTIKEQKKRAKKYLGLGDIEGQEFGGGDDDELENGSHFKGKGKKAVEEEDFDSEDELDSVGSDGEGQVMPTTKKGMGVKIEA